MRISFYSRIEETGRLLSQLPPSTSQWSSLFWNPGIGFSNLLRKHRTRSKWAAGKGGASGLAT